MKIDILNINEFIKKYKCPEVTNPIYFNGTSPTGDGLFSYSLFGLPGSKERKQQFGYIRLKKKFVHPVAYRLLITLDKKIQSALMSEKNFIIDSNGFLKEDNEKGMTGVTFIYNNFNKLFFKRTDSLKRDKKLELLNKLSINEIFLDKFLIIPAFYRDFNPSKTSNSKIIAVDKINDDYSSILRMVTTISEDEEYDFIGANTESSIQMKLNEIYDSLTQSLATKNGIIHKSLLGKNIDYATRSVISAPKFSCNKWNEVEVPFGNTGIPLSQLCVLFYPFFIKYIQDLFELHRNELNRFRLPDGSYVKTNLDEFNEDKIKKMLELYIKSPDTRFSTIRMKDENGNEYKMQLFRDDLKRDFTLTDLIYITAYDVCKDKHVYLTRYPIESYRLGF